MSDLVNIMKRAELVQIASFAMESVASKKDTIDFETDEHQAYQELESELERIVANEKMIYDILPIISTYSARVGDLQFMIGMKYGAKVVTELIT